MSYRVRGEGTRERLLPQRHRITGFAAVVERGNGEKMPHRGLWKGYMEKAASATAPNHGFCCRCGKEDG